MINRQKFSSLKRVLLACRYSMRGFAGAGRHEAAFRQELLLVVILIPLGIFLGHNGIDAAVDRIGPERHELSGRAKDLGSAAVFLSLVIVAIT